jgi:hypothetical protein
MKNPSHYVGEGFKKIECLGFNSHLPLLQP